MPNRAFASATLAICVIASCAAAAKPVVSNVYENLDADKALTNAPVTFSRIGGDGDFTKGITPMIDGKRLRSQVNVLRRGPDKSIRHALVTFTLPKLEAGGKVKIDWLNEKPPAPAMVKRAHSDFGVSPKLILTRPDGGPITSDLGKLVMDDLDRRPGIKRIHIGRLMTEWEIHDVPVDAQGEKDPHIDIYWRLRFYWGQKTVRIAAVVERCKPRKKGLKIPTQYKFDSVKLLNGEQVLYEEGPIDHIDQMRYRILVWSGGALENIHRRPNYEYWWTSKFVPKYEWSAKAKTPAAIDAFYAKRGKGRQVLKKGQGILEHGIILRHMPNTGGRWDLGPYPSWTAAYLLAGEGAGETYKTILHADGNGAGAFFVHVRQDGAPGYNVFTINPKPQSSGYRINLYKLPDGKKTPSQPDHAHTPSTGYIGYLLTGDKFYAEETSFWASYQMGEWPHRGLKWHQMDRSFAWSLRHVTDAAFILPDDHPLLGYFTKGVEKCLDQMTEKLVKSGRKVHSPIAGVFQCSGRQDWVNAERCSTWMYAWVVWSLGNAAHKGFDKAPAVRDWAAEYIVGLYTSEDEFLAPDGKTYKYNPRDAIPYSTAIALLETEIVTMKNGKKGMKLMDPKKRRRKYLENYGAIWYYTKLNVDNGWYKQDGMTTQPDANGVWPLRAVGKGWGAGWMRSAYAGGKVTPQANRHIRGMTGMSVAVEAGVPKANLAWKRMMEYGGAKGKYGILIVPRTGLKP